MITARYAVSGMTCEHCVHAVTEEVSKLPGVSSVDIALVPDGVSTVIVSSEAALDPERVRDAVDEAGYALASTA